jgi:uncharacterized membrane protein
MKLPRLVGPVLAILGILSLINGSEMFFFPSRWFFKLVPGVPDTGPFNAHLVADGGAFNLALGVGLLIAARDPARHWAVLMTAALAGVIHSALHLWSHETGILPFNHMATEAFGIYVPALILTVLSYLGWRASSARHPA